MRAREGLLRYSYMKNIFSVVSSGAVALGLFFIAPLTHAQSSGSGSLNTAPIQNLSDSLIGVLNTVVVPVVFALAFIVFIWGVFQAFILNGTNEEKRQEGTKFVFWSIIGFVIMLSIWGLVNLVGSFLPMMNNTRPGLPTFGPAQTSSSDTAPTSARAGVTGGAAISPLAPKPEVQPVDPVPCPSGDCVPGTSVPRSKTFGPSL